MKCPRSGNPLKTLKVGGIAIEISENCGGGFFDNSELNNFNSSNEVRGDALVKHLKQFNNQLGNEQERINCPKCTDVVMMRRYYSPLKVVEIDECPQCAGIWLDTGELEKLQDIKLSEKELSFLRNQMVESTRGAHLETPVHRFIEVKDKSNLEKVFDIAANILRW